MRMSRYVKLGSKYFIWLEAVGEPLTTANRREATPFVPEIADMVAKKLRSLGYDAEVVK